MNTIENPKFLWKKKMWLRESDDRSFVNSHFTLESFFLLKLQNAI